MEKLLKEILKELKFMHHHLDRFDLFYRMVNGIKENKEGIWIEKENKE